jgi:hypothetical protein
MIRTLAWAGAHQTLWKCRPVETLENQTPVFHAFPPPLEIADSAISTFPQRRALFPSLQFLAEDRSRTQLCAVEKWKSQKP